VPKQRSSGGRARLYGISKRGDRYLRTLLIHGARSALGRVRDKQDPRSLWLGKMRQRRHPNIVAVALANKNARIALELAHQRRHLRRKAFSSRSLKANLERKDL
jgi:transposase